MKTISIDAPNVRMETSLRDSAANLELSFDLPPEIDQRDLEDLQTLAEWYKSASIEFADIDDVFSEFEDLRSALS